MLKPITQLMTDESEGGIFRFTFYCDVCGSAKQSHPFISETEGYDKLVASAERDREHSDAYERANREMIRSFNRCPLCMRFVCDDCFNLLEDKYLCSKCNAEAEQRNMSKHGELEQTGKRKHRELYFAVAACFVLVLGGIGILPYTIVKSDKDLTVIDIANDPVPLAAFTGLDVKTESYVGGAEILKGPGFLIPRIESAVIPAETTDVQLLLFNPMENEYDLMFEITLNGEALYSSGRIEPGMCVEDITLTRGLAQGEYKAVMTIRANDPESFAETSSANSEFTLIAKQKGVN